MNKKYKYLLVPSLMSLILANDQSFKDLLSLADKIVTHQFNRGIFDKGIGKERNKYPTVKKMFNNGEFIIVKPEYLSPVLDMQMFVMNHYKEGDILVLLVNKDKIDVYTSLSKLFLEAGRKVDTFYESGGLFYDALTDKQVNLTSIILTNNVRQHMILEEPAPGEKLEEAEGFALAIEDEEEYEAIAIEDDEEEYVVETIEEDEDKKLIEETTEAIKENPEIEISDNKEALTEEENKEEIITDEEENETSINEREEIDSPKEIEEEAADSSNEEKDKELIEDANKELENSEEDKKEEIDSFFKDFDF